MEGEKHIPKANVVGQDFHLKENVPEVIDEYGNVTITTDEETIYSHLARCTVFVDNRNEEKY